MSLPKTMKIDAMPLYLSLQNLIKNRNHGEAAETVALTFFIREFADNLIESFNSSNLNHWSEKTEQTCQELGIDKQDYLASLNSFSLLIDPYLKMFTGVVDYWQYHKCVSIGYNLATDMTMSIKIMTDDFRTDGMAILIEEIRQAVMRGDKVPHKLLELLSYTAEE